MIANDRRTPGVTSSRIAVLRMLLENGPLSRSSLAEATQLSRSVLTDISQELLDTGLLQEMPIAHNRQRRGRPSILLSINPAHGYFVGASITDHPPRLVLTDAQGKALGQQEIAAPGKPQQVAEAIRRGMVKLLRQHHVTTDQVLGIGIAMSGLVDYRGGTCRYSAALDWHDIPIAEMVEKRTGIAAYVDNDANAAAIGEKLFGRARELHDFSVVTLGDRIGCAHAMHGRLYRGHDGGAGEIAHMTIDPDGPHCRCGRRGCLDVYASNTAMLEAATAAGLRVETPCDIESLAAQGNALAMAILRKAGHALGMAVASLIQINNPELVLFADMQGIGNGLFTTTARQTLETNILPRFLSSTRLLFDQVESSFLACGAASLAAHQYLLESTFL